MSSKKVVQHIIERWAMSSKNAARFAGGDTTPGFSHALGLEHIDLATTSWDDSTRTLTTKHTMDKELCWNGDGGTSLSTYLALIDEQSTHAVLGAQPNSLRAGVSVQLQADLFHSAPVGTEVEIVSSVTRLGRKLAFCDAQIRGVDDGKVHCRGVHVKYLPMEGAVFDELMSKQWAWPYVKAYLDRNPEIPESGSRDNMNDVIDPHLSMQGLGSGTFDVGKQHTNPFVSLHGGCQAILMEKVGQQLADDQLGEHSQLTSIQSQYHTAGKGQVDVQAKVLEKKQDELFIQVTLSRPHDGTIVSNGNLRWTTK